MRPKIKLTIIEQKGCRGCHRGHKVGDTFDFDTQRGEICPMALHAGFPYTALSLPFLSRKEKPPDVHSSVQEPGLCWVWNWMNRS